jgi:transcriptional regulator MraZ
VFFGTFNHAIDAKGRTSLPVRFREALAAANEQRIVLIQNPLWRGIQALPYSLWTEVVKKVAEGSPFDAKLQMNFFRFLSTAQEVDLDPHGRVLVPPNLRQYAGLQKDVVWVGMLRTIHLYDRAAYDERMATEVPVEQQVDFFKL